MVQAQMTRTEGRLRTDCQDNRGNHGVEDWLVEELHDGVAQSLWYLGVELLALNQEISPNEAGLRAQVETLGHVAQEAYDQLRAILGQAWSPDRPGGQTLDDVVQQEVESFEQRSGVAVGLTLGAAKCQASAWQAHHVAAILHEALCNAWRHGQVRCVQVELRATEETGSLTVVDGGPGFNIKGSREGHYGLATMQKRGQALGGVVKIQSKPGSGTRVNLTFPLGVSH